MHELINEQINKKLSSPYLYIAMAAYCDEENLPGFAKWLHVQADEEHEYAMKFFAVLGDHGGRVSHKASLRLMLDHQLGKREE